MTGPIEFSTINLPIDSIIMLSLYFTLGVFAIFTAILYYHWKSYAPDLKMTTYTLTLYFATTIPLLTIMTILAFIIT